MEFPVFWFPLTASSPLSTTEKGLLSLSIHQVFTDVAQMLLNLLSFMLNSHSSLSFRQMLQSFNQLCGPSLSLLQNININLLLASPELGIALQMWSQIVMVQEMDCFPLLGNALPHASQEAAGCTCHFHHLSSDWDEADYWPVVLHIHPSWRLGWHSLSSRSQEPPLITRSLKDNWA